MKLLFKFNIVIAVCTLIAYLSVLVSPAYIWWFGFLGYSIPFWIFINFICLLFWIIRANMNLILSLVVIILGLNHVATSFSIASHKAKEIQGFEVMSYNVGCFNPSDRIGQKDKNVFKKITDDIIALKPAILCFQEYCSYPTIRAFDTQQKLLDTVFENLYYKNRTANTAFSTAGLAVFSTFPMVSKGDVINKVNETIAIYVDLQISTDTIRVYNTHLFSMGLIKPENKESIGAFNLFFNKLKQGFKQKAIEADIILKHLKDSPYPVLIAGDFNELPYSYVYHKYGRRLNNSFEVAGNGLGITYNGKIPLLRIDNQFADEHFKVVAHRVLNEMNITDHFPIIVKYELD